MKIFTSTETIVMARLKIKTKGDTRPQSLTSNFA